MKYTRDLSVPLLKSNIEEDLTVYLSKNDIGEDLTVFLYIKS